VRICYNCNGRFHFVAECPYEKREDHGRKIILKSKSKSPSKKPFVKKGGPKKKQPKFVFLTQEEYSVSESDEEETSTSEMATIATTSTSSHHFLNPPMRTLSSRTSSALWPSLMRYHPHLPPPSLRQMMLL
jgi:hypothetical protein